MVGKAAVVKGLKSNAYRTADGKFNNELFASHLAQINSDLSGTKLENVDFSGARLGKVNLEGANLKSANFENAKLNGANLKQTQLESARFSGAKLTEVSLVRADSRWSDFKGVVFNNVHAEHATFGVCMLEGARFEGVNLRGVNFFNSNLRNARFVEEQSNRPHFRTQLYGTLFDGARLDGADFSNSVISKATNFTGVSMVGAKIERLNGMQPNRRRAFELAILPKAKRREKMAEIAQSRTKELEQKRLVRSISTRNPPKKLKKTFRRIAEPHNRTGSDKTVFISRHGEKEKMYFVPQLTWEQLGYILHDVSLGKNVVRNKIADMSSRERANYLSRLKTAYAVVRDVPGTVAHARLRYSGSGVSREDYLATVKSGLREGITMTIKKIKAEPKMQFHVSPELLQRFKLGAKGDVKKRGPTNGPRHR